MQREIPGRRDRWYRYLHKQATVYNTRTKHQNTPKKAFQLNHENKYSTGYIQTQTSEQSRRPLHPAFQLGLFATCDLCPCRPACRKIRRRSSVNFWVVVQFVPESKVHRSVKLLSRNHLASPSLIGPDLSASLRFERGGKMNSPNEQLGEMCAHRLTLFNLSPSGV
jgi:hypothetical protein